MRLKGDWQIAKETTGFISAQRANKRINFNAKQVHTFY